MEIKDYKCKCGHNDFFFADKGTQKGIYCSYCGKWFKWADKDEQNLAIRQEPILEKDGTLVVTTEHYENVNRVLVEYGTNGSLFYRDQEPTTKNNPTDYCRAFKIACDLLNGSVLYGTDADRIFEIMMAKDGVVSNDSYESYILNNLQELDRGQYASKPTTKNDLGVDAVSRQAVKEQMIKYGFHAPDMTVTEFVEDLPPVNPQEPFINKLCVSEKVCEHDKQMVLDKIRAEIEFEVDHRTNMLCAEDVLEIIDKYKAESEDKEDKDGSNNN